VALDAFGPQRLMYGGDWPMSVLAGGYAKVWSDLAQLFAELSVTERAAMLGLTAAAFYRIPAARCTRASGRRGVAGTSVP
jgi:L-fuconolactonase